MKNFFKKCIPVFQQDKQLSKIYYINGQEVRPVQQLAQGSYAFVYSLSRDDLVLKHMIIQTREALQEAVKEVDILYRLRNNQNINKIYNVFVGGNEVNLARIQQETSSVQLPVDFDIFLERCQCSLLDYMNNQPNFIQENVIWNVAGGILCGLCAIQASGFSNRDMKAENVLLSSMTPSAATIRLCDLGSASTESFSGENILKNQGLRARLEAEISSKTTPQYRAPELIDLFARLPVGPQQDVFSFGVTIFRLMYKRLPFPEGELLANFNVRYSFPDEVDASNKNMQYDQASIAPKYSNQLKDLVRKSLVKDPRQRATVFQLMQLIEAKIGAIGAPPEPQGFNQQVQQFGAPGLSASGQSVPQSPVVQQSNTQVGGNPFSNFQIHVNPTQPQQQNTFSQPQNDIMNLLDWNQPVNQQIQMQPVNQVQKIIEHNTQQNNNDIMKNIWGDETNNQSNDIKQVIDKVMFISCQNLGSPEYENNYKRIDQLIDLCKIFLQHPGTSSDQKLLKGIHKRIQEMIDQNKHSIDINKDTHLHLLKDIATLYQVAAQYCVITQFVPYNQTSGFKPQSKQQFQNIEQACVNLINLVNGLSILVNQSQYLQKRFNEIKTVVVDPSIKLAQNCCKKEVQLNNNDINRLQMEYQNLVGKDIFGIKVQQQLQLNSGTSNIVDDVFGF